MGFFADDDLTPNRIEIARQRVLAGAGYIDLASSNPTTQGLLFPPALLRAASDSYWQARRYAPDPRGGLAAREAIAAGYRRRTPPLALALDDIFITASTSEAYGLLFTLLCDPGDNLLAPSVSYPLFEYLAAAQHVELRPYPLDEARGWAIDEAGLLGAADARTRGVLLVSPHNPTGAVLARPLAALDRLGLPLIVDEVFAAFAYALPEVPPLAALHPALPVFTLNGISKQLALPDMKLGWIALNPPARSYAARLELLNDTFLGASGLIQHMLPALLREGRPFVEAMVAQVRRNLEAAVARLAACPRLRVRPPDGGYYLFPEVFGWDDEEELVLFLLERGVLVHPGYFYGEPEGCHLMISCLTAPDQLVAGLDRLVAALSE
jgi:alanine-synthesizing transaminase